MTHGQSRTVTVYNRRVERLVLFAEKAFQSRDDQDEMITIGQLLTALDDMKEDYLERHAILQARVEYKNIRQGLKEANEILGSLTEAK